LQSSDCGYASDVTGTDRRSRRRARGRGARRQGDCSAGSAR